MRRIAVSLMAIVCSFAFVSQAQETNAPATEIENFELQTGTVIVKGFDDVGSLTTSAGTISVRCKESSDPAGGQKKYGVSVLLTSDRTRGFMVVDYEELVPLIQAMDYLSKISYNVTPMPVFDAEFTTKSGVEVIAHSERHQGGIHNFIRFGNGPRISLTSDQFAQLQNLFTQAKTTIDTIREKEKKSSP